MKRTSGSSKVFTIKPGFGSETLHVGQTEQDVKIVLGKPESRTRKYEGQYYYNYPSKGIEVDFGGRVSGIKFIFYFREGVRGNRQAKVVTDSSSQAIRVSVL